MRIEPDNGRDVEDLDDVDAALTGLDMLGKIEVVSGLSAVELSR